VPESQPKEEEKQFKAMPRPVTSHGRSSDQQQVLLQEMARNRPNAARPKTAATSTMKDEARIKKKMQMLEDLERKVELDIEAFNSK